MLLGLAWGGDLLSIFGVGNALRTANAASKAAKVSSKILNKVDKAARLSGRAYSDATNATYKATRARQGVNAASLQGVSPNMAIKLLKRANQANDVAKVKNARYTKLLNHYDNLLKSNEVVLNSSYILRNKANDAKLAPMLFTPSWSFANGYLQNVIKN